MFEIFTSKKTKQHRAEKAEKLRLEKGKEKEKRKEEPIKGKEEHGKKNEDVAATIVLERAEGVPILDQEDEKFLKHLTSPSDSSISNGDDSQTPPPLPPRVKTPVIELEDSDISSFASKDNGEGTGGGDGDGKDKDKEKSNEKEDKHKQNGEAKPDPKPKRFAFVTNLSRNISLRRKHPHHASKSDQHLSVPPTSTSAPSPEQEVLKEQTDLERVLSDLNLAASADNRAFSLSRESAETLRRFTQVLRDLVRGVPTAYGDLVALIEDRDGVLARAYDGLPRSLKKLVAQLPDKVTSSLAPEILAAAAEAQGLGKDGKDGDKDGKDKKSLLSPADLLQLITRPGAVVGLLKGIVNALKTRWPAFVGTNVLWSVAVFLLLSALWYCHKRGRETRLEKEAAEAEAAAAAAASEVSGEVKAEAAVEGKKDEEGTGKEDGRETDEQKSQGSQSQSQPQPTVSVSAPAEEIGGKKE